MVLKFCDSAFKFIPATQLTHNRVSSFDALQAPQGRPQPGLSESEQAALIRTKRLAYIIDSSLFSLCGVRFGWGSVAGLVPVIGDFADLLLGLVVYRSAVGTLNPPAPLSLRLHMLWNILFDFVIGLIPLVGDIVDAAYKANIMNAVLLETFLRERGNENMKGFA